MVVKSYRIVFALLAIVAMVYQAYHLDDAGVFKPGNYFSFFTIQNNILSAAIFLYLVIRTRPSTPALDYIRGAITLYLTLTGIVYGFLLSGYTAEIQTAVVWVDNVLHKIIPLAIFADWLIDPPKSRLDFRKALWWLVYPLAYLAYTLIRGPIVDWYPYPFLDPDHPDYSGGYWRVAAYGVGIAAGVVIFTWIIVVVGNMRGDKSEPNLAGRPAPSPS